MKKKKKKDFFMENVYIGNPEELCTKKKYRKWKKFRPPNNKMVDTCMTMYFTFLFYVHIQTILFCMADNGSSYLYPWRYTAI